MWEGGFMKVMTQHEFFDEEVEFVLMADFEEIREIVLCESFEGSLLINKADVIALAKEFGLIVYEHDASL